MAQTIGMRTSISKLSDYLAPYKPLPQKYYNLLLNQLLLTSNYKNSYGKYKRGGCAREIYLYWAYLR